MNYIPLRVKTSYSLLTSLNDIKKMISFCKNNNINAIAITDNNMYGVMEFYKECLKSNIKPIIGLELIIDDELFILYAKNYFGYQNLTRIVYVMQNEKITYDVLKKFCDNLICVATINNYEMLNNIYDDIYLGYENINERNTDITDKVVYINEIRCMNKNDIEYLKYLYLIKEGKKITDLVSFDIKSNCYFDFNDIDYLNALDIANKCDIKFVQDKSLMPKFGVLDSKTYLFDLCKKGLYKRFDGKVTKKYYDRLLYELDVIDKMGFNDYFLVVMDYVKYAKKNNILVGSGRGSAAGSLVSFCLGITEVDPIKYDLLFERFLNPERVTMPDIDIDFDANYRDDVVDYVINKYGKDRVVPIITFTTLSSKQVLRDIGRIFDVNISKMDELTKFIGFNQTLTDALNNINLKIYLNNNTDIKNVYNIALKLEGLKRQISVHAAAVIISSKSLDSYIPLTKYNDYYISGYSMEHLEELGLLKMDFLSLKNLSSISNMLSLIPNLTYSDIRIDDKKSMSLFHNAMTCGIFQFESSGMKNFLLKLRPNTFDDIVAAIALFRPGPSDNIDTYIRRKNGTLKIDYLDDSLKDVLKPTYGIIVYQEQIMQIANIMAGYTYGEADMLRRAMSKKKKEILENEKDKFIKNSIKRGYKEDVAIKTYDFIMKFANYGFNKSHSVAYSMIALKMAYLKVNYKEYFMSSLLTSVIGSETKTKEYIDECKKLNIKLFKPSINKSNCYYVKENDGIRFPLSIIRNVGSITCKEIVNERLNGEYIDFFDFVKRTYGKSVNKKAIDCLIDAGVFDEFNYNHNTLHNIVDVAINYATLARDLDDSLIEKPIIELFDEFSDEEIIKREKDVFGFYLSNHPVSKYKVRYNNIVNLNDIHNYFDKHINLIVYVNNIKTILSKKGDEMAFLTISDEYISTDLTVFPNRFKSISEINKGDIVLVNAKVEKRMSKYQLILESLKKL